MSSISKNAQAYITKIIRYVAITVKEHSMPSGPPYVDMVVNAATMMDKQNDGIELGRRRK